MSTDEYIENLEQQNKQMREALEKITETYFQIHGADGLYKCYNIAKQALGEIKYEN